MRFTLNDIVRHPKLVIMGRVLQVNEARQGYVVCDLLSGDNFFCSDADSNLVNHWAKNSIDLIRSFTFLSDSHTWLNSQPQTS